MYFKLVSKAFLDEIAIQIFLLRDKFTHLYIKRHSSSNKKEKLLKKIEIEFHQSNVHNSGV